MESGWHWLISSLLSTTVQLLTQVLTEQLLMEPEITLLPDMAVPMHVPKQGELVARPFDRSGAGRQIGLAWRTTSSRSAEFREFGAALTKAARSAGIAVT